jgi:hypothetical protein
MVHDIRAPASLLEIGGLTMGNTVIGALRVVLGMDTASFQKDAGKAGKAMDGIGKDADKLNGTFNNAFGNMSRTLATFAKGVGAGLVAGGLTEMIAQVGQVARGVAEIGDSAKRAGLSTKAFQELSFVADQNRVSIDALTDGLKEMSLRADEFIVTGGGPAAEAFKRLGFNADQLKAKLKDPSELFLEIVGRLQKLDKAARLRISDEVWGGTGGEQFVQLLDEGERKIRNSMRAANELGMVLDDQMIAKAAAVDRQFGLVADTVGTNLKGAIVSASAALIEFTKSYKSFFDDYNGRQNLKNAGEAIGGMLGDAPAIPKTPAAPKSGRLPSATDIVREALVQQRVEEAFASSGTSTGGEGAKRTTEKQISSYERVMMALKEEMEMVGKSELAQRILTAQRDADVTAASQQGQTIAGVVTKLYEQHEAMNAAADVSQFLQNTLQDAFADMVPAIETGNKALDGFLNTLIEATTQGLLFGSGPLASLFGSSGGGSAGGGSGGLLSGLFKSLPGFAQGGSIMPGGMGSLSGIDSQIVAFRKKPSEQVDIYDPGSVRSGSVSGPSVTYAPTIHAPGATTEAVNALARAQAQDRQEFTRNVISTIRDAQKRRII